MSSIPLGEAFDLIAHRVNDADTLLRAVVLDTHDIHVYEWGDLTDVFDMRRPAATRPDWLARGGETGLYVIDGALMNPIVVYAPRIWPHEVEVSESLLPVTAVSMEIDGHEFDPVDHTWICVCGNYMEPDAHYCGECPRANPFLGVLI